LHTLYRWTVQPKPNLITKSVSEFLGSLIFHFVGSVAPTPVANAAILIVLVYYTARMSGAHLNPALSVTFALLGYINPVELVFYWMAQMSGAVMGAMWIALMMPRASIRGDALSSQFGCFLPSTALSDAQIFGWEATCTFAFILPIFSVVWYTQSKSGYGNTGPLIVGLSLYASASAASPWTGGALNPARALASPIVFQCPGGIDSKLWLYVLGELLGAILVPIAIIPWYGVSNRIFGNMWQIVSSEKASCDIDSNKSNDTQSEERTMDTASDYRTPKGGSIDLPPNNNNDDPGPKSGESFHTVTILPIINTSVQGNRGRSIERVKMLLVPSGEEISYKCVSPKSINT
jgi:glycerol uptake facilitator-like aquaporin